MVKVEVTAADIAAGKKQSCYNCPVSLALNRVYADYYKGDFDPSCNVYDSGKGFYIEVGHVHIRAPEDVSSFVLDFDSDYAGAAKPFSFELPPFTSEEWFEKCGNCGSNRSLNSKCEQCE